MLCTFCDSRINSLKTVSIQQVKTVCMELILLILALTKTKTFSSLNAKTLLMEVQNIEKRQHEKSAEEKEKSLQDSIRKSWYW